LIRASTEQSGCNATVDIASTNSASLHIVSIQKQKEFPVLANRLLPLLPLPPTTPTTPTAPTQPALFLLLPLHCVTITLGLQGYFSSTTKDLRAVQRSDWRSGKPGIDAPHCPQSESVSNWEPVTQYYCVDPRDPQVPVPSRAL